MVKQLLLPLAGVAAFIILVGLLTQNRSSINWSKYFPAVSTPVLSQTMAIGNKTIQLEIVKTEKEREKGLSGRTSLPTDTGMLFVFDSKQVRPIFWMKDMVMSIDIIWISSDKVVKIDKNVQPPSKKTPDSSLLKYSSGQPVDYVLEVNAGFTDENGIKVNDSVTLPTL